MTLIEIYDTQPINNIIGMLTIQPQKTIFLCTAEMPASAKECIAAVLRSKGLSIEIDTRIVDPFDMSDVHAVLRELVIDEDECVFDVTGGDENLISAVANVATRYDLQSQRYYYRLNKSVDVDGDGELVPTVTPSLTVKELVMLHDGVLAECTPSPACTEQETEVLWQLTRSHPREWNDHLKQLATVEKGRYHNQTVVIPSKCVPARFKQYAHVRKMFLERDIILNQSTPAEIRYTYTKPYYHSMFAKAGNILEHKAFYAAQTTLYQEQPLFDECCMGVSINWNTDPVSCVKPTNNEVDLILMRGVQPLFVSCKGGDVDEDELYKLETVADRFGGKYARKMLIVTELEPRSTQARDALAQRAHDMGIYLVPNAGRLRSEQWHEEFLKAMELI